MAEGIDWFEGFEKDDSFSVWESNHGIARNAAWARSGGYGMRPNGSLGTGWGESPILTPSVSKIIGFAFTPKLMSPGSLSNNLFIAAMVQAPGTVLSQLHFTHQNTLGIPGVGYTTRSLEIDAWYYLEWKVLVSPTVGYQVIRINGDVAFEAYNINTGTPAFGGVNQVYLGRLGGGNDDTEFWYDDIYVRNPAIGDFLGDVEVIGTELVDDFTTQWVRNVGPKNYLTQIENTPDEDATHVTTDVAAKDLYEVEDSSFGGVIHAVQVVSRARKTSTELWRMRNVIHVGGIESEGPYRFMSYPNYETFAPDVFGHQPNGSDWSLPAFNAMKVGPYAEPV